MLPFLNCLRNRHPSRARFSLLVIIRQIHVCFFIPVYPCSSVVDSYLAKPIWNRNGCNILGAFPKRELAQRMLMKLIKTTFAFLACASTITLFTGCASVLCGPKQTFSIGSKPFGADVFVYDSHGEKFFENKTPCVVTLARVKPDADRANYVVVVKKQGFASVQIPITSEVNKAFFLNIVTGTQRFCARIVCL